MADLVSKEDLEGALSPATVIAIFDDDKDGVGDAEQIAKVCRRATVQVQSWVIGHYTFGADAETDELLRAAALDFAVAYAFERHPEYVRTFGEEPRAEKWKRAEAICSRIKEGVQRPPKVEQAQGPSKTIGGVIYESGTRFGEYGQ